MGNVCASLFPKPPQQSSKGKRGACCKGVNMENDSHPMLFAWQIQTLLINLVCAECV